MKKQTVYKWVRVEADGRYFSLFADHEMFEVEYTIGKLAKAKVGKLFCFARIEDALRFKAVGPVGFKTLMLECTTICKPVPQIHHGLSPDYVDKDSYIAFYHTRAHQEAVVMEFWNKWYKKGGSPLGHSLIRPGSTLVSSLTPVKVIPHE